MIKNVTAKRSGSSEPCHWEELKLFQVITLPPIEEEKASTSEKIEALHPDKNYEFKKTMVGK